MKPAANTKYILGTMIDLAMLNQSETTGLIDKGLEIPPPRFGFGICKLNQHTMAAT